MVTDMRNRLDVFVNVQGGGFTGQAGAICQGIARALKDMFGDPPPRRRAPMAKHAGGMAKKLRDSGYLTRDGRMKERKKYGRKGAARASSSRSADARTRKPKSESRNPKRKVRFGFRVLNLFRISRFSSSKSA